MIRNHFIIAYRSLLRNKSFSLINILGLCLGMTACILILHFVSFEWSFDTSHPNAKRLYRVNFKRFDKGFLAYTSGMNVPNTAPVLKEVFPEIEEVTRLYSLRSNFTCTMTGKDVNDGEQTFNEKNVYFADATVMTLFDFHVVTGDQKTLTQPFTAILTASTAKKYFGNANPIGKTIRLNCLVQEQFRVGAVIQDLPPNSHLDIDALLSYSTVAHTDAAERANDNWGTESVFTYFLLRQGVDAIAFQRNMDNYVREFVVTEDNTFAFDLQPVENIHLDTGIQDEIKAGGSSLIITFLLITAGFILILAWINYTNLTTARVFQRAKEVGLRKITGAGWLNIFTQFLIESLVVNGIALCLALAAAQLVAPSFIQHVGIESGFNLSTIALPFYLLLLFFVTGTLLSGGYTALVLSTGNPVHLFKGTYRSVKKNTAQQALVTIQFIVSISLIIGTVVVFQQLSFMKRQRLGIEIDNTILVRTPSVVDSTYHNRLQHLKNDLTANSQIKHVATSAIKPGSENTWLADVTRSNNNEQKTALAVNIIDSDYLHAFGVQVLSGRNFLATEQRKGKRFGEELERVMVNRSGAERLGFTNMDDAINQKIYWNGSECIIVGVVADFHQRSLHYAVQPSMFVLDNENSVYYAVKFNSSVLRREEMLSLVKKHYIANFPGNPFDYLFLDDSFASQYKSDEQFSAVFGSFAGLTIFIACLGLYGLVSYNVIQRTKEVGIRKILGAGILQLQVVLLQRYVRLTVIAFAVAVPITYWLCDEWLSTFAYHIAPAAWMFILPGALVIVVALLSVCFQSTKAAISNPVDSLRAE